MTDSRTIKPFLGSSRSWLFALIALLSARQCGRLLQSFAAALERHWPMLLDNVIYFERHLRHWRLLALRVIGVVAASLVSVGIDAAGHTAVSSAQSLSQWKAIVSKEIAVSLYSRCASSFGV